MTRTKLAWYNHLVVKAYYIRGGTKVEKTVLFRSGPNMTLTQGVFVQDLEPENPDGWIAVRTEDGVVVGIRKYEVIKA